MKKNKNTINPQIKKDIEFIDKYFITFLQKSVIFIKNNNALLFAKIKIFKEKIGAFCWSYFTFFTFWVCIMPHIIYEVKHYIYDTWAIWIKKYTIFLEKYKYCKELHEYLIFDLSIILGIVFLMFHYSTIWYVYCSRYFIVFLFSIICWVTPPILSWMLVIILYDRFIVYWLCISDIWFLHIIIPCMKHYRTMEKYEKFYFIYRGWFEYIFVDSILDLIIYIYQKFKFLLKKVFGFILAVPVHIYTICRKIIVYFFSSIKLFLVRIPLKFRRLQAQYYTLKDNYKEAKWWCKQKKKKN